jgi:hypothetical protein
VVVSSLQPNQPGVLHVVEDDEVVVVEELVMVPLVVVVSSRQPHHPGVWQVVVRVLVLVELEDTVVLLSLLFPSNSFQSGQS